VPGGGEPGHIDPDLGQDDRGGDRPDTRDVIEAGRRRGERGQLRLDLCIDSGDVGVDRVDAAQHPGEQECVVVIEVPVERFLEQAELGPYPRARQLREHPGVALPADQGGHHRPPGDPENVGGHDGEFDAGVLEEFFDPVLLRRAGAE
jgi:hypothetical protein